MSFTAEDLKKQAKASRDERARAQAEDDRDVATYDREKAVREQEQVVIANISETARLRVRASHQCTLTVTAEEHENLKAHARHHRITLRELMLTALRPFLREPPRGTR